MLRMQLSPTSYCRDAVESDIVHTSPQNILQALPPRPDSQSQAASSSKLKPAQKSKISGKSRPTTVSFKIPEQVSLYCICNSRILKFYEFVLLKVFVFKGACN